MKIVCFGLTALCYVYQHCPSLIGPTKTISKDYKTDVCLTNTRIKCNHCQRVGYYAYFLVNIFTLASLEIGKQTIFCKTKVFAAFHCTAGCRVWIRLTFLMSLWCYNKMLTESHIPSKYESFSEKLATKHIYKSSFSLPLSGGEKLAKCKIHVNAAQTMKTSMQEIIFSFMP